MKLTALALTLVLALTAAPVLADTTLAVAGHAADQIPLDLEDTGHPPPGSHNKVAPKIKDLAKIDVTAKLDQARNALSPTTGSNQYVITSKDIEALPLGASTSFDQVLLQAPGVVQDSYGGLHVRGDHANIQYRINGIILPESPAGFGQSLDPRMMKSVQLLNGALPAQYGLRTAGVVDITTKSGHELGNGGSMGYTGGSFGTVNPYASAWGSSDRWSGFATANFMQNDVGVQNPTASRAPLHDHSNQSKLFGDISYLIDDDTRVSLMYGSSNNRFQIPNNPGQMPSYQLYGQTMFDSSQLNEQQNEKNRFGILSLQGKLGQTDYQMSLSQRYGSIAYAPDYIGDLMFNGVAASIEHSDRNSALQADFSTPWGDNHTVRYGLYGAFDRGQSNNTSAVFPGVMQPDGTITQTSTTPFTIVDNNGLLARTWSAYLQDEWSLNDAWTVNYGLRGDQYSFKSTERQLSPRLGVIWQARDDTTVHAGYARYFTPPATEVINLTSIQKFQNTTNALPNVGVDVPLSERTHYFDIGVSQNVTSALTLGVDAYYKKISRLQDEGQFGTALIYSNFNYKEGRVGGVEFTASYNEGPWSAYANVAWSKAQGKDITTGQYHIAPAELVYISNHWIFLDHDQRVTSSGGVSYAFTDTTKVGANYLFGTGLRATPNTPPEIPNGGSLPDYFQLNLSLSHDFMFDSIGKLHTQLAVINALDRVYELRDGSGVGVGAPQYGPRRGAYVTVQKDF